MTRMPRDYTKLAPVRPSQNGTETVDSQMHDFMPATTKFLIIDAAQNPGPQKEWESHGIQRKGLDEIKQNEFFENLQKLCQKLEGIGISTLCIDITDQSRLYPGANRESDAILIDNNLTGLGVGRDVFLKRFMDTFTDIDDILTPNPKIWAKTVVENGGRKPFLKKLMKKDFDVKSIPQIVKSPKLWNFIVGQRKDNKAFLGRIITGLLNKDDYFGRPTALSYLKEANVDHAVIAGAMAGFCVAGTAMSAAMKGLNVTILSDMVIGWENNSYTQVVWNKENPKHHAREIDDRLNQIIGNPASAGFRDADTKLLMAARERIKIMPSSQVIAALEARADAQNQYAQIGLQQGTENGQSNENPKRPLLSLEKQSLEKPVPRK